MLWISFMKHVLTENRLDLANLFADAGHEIRIVGGAVRDTLIGVVPKDIDFATTATPDTMMEICDFHNISYIPTGLQHGTITIVYGGETFEVTTLRVDTSTDGRHATVQFTDDWKVDAERRDFTINAMSLDMQGNVHDYFGGKKDLKNRRIRFVGDASKRINEDFLRILRFFRFQTRMNKTWMDNDTKSAIRDNAAGLRLISGERVWMEMEKILSTRMASDVLKIMAKLKVLDKIGLSNRLDHGVMSYVELMTNDPIINLAASIRSLGDADGIVKNVVDGWKVPAKERDLLKFLMGIQNTNLDLHTLQCMAANPKIGKDWAMAAAAVLLQKRQFFELKEWEVPVFPVQGRHLMNRGMKPGPEFGKVLSDLKNVWENSGFTMSSSDLLKTLD